MTMCNRCGSLMLPDQTALVPALKCSAEECGRLIPMPGSKAATRPQTKAQLAGAQRAARRMKMAREGHATR